MRVKIKILRCVECYLYMKLCVGNFIFDFVLFDFFCVIYDCYFSYLFYSKYDKI